MFDAPCLIVRRDPLGKRANVKVNPRRIDRPSVGLPSVAAALQYAQEQSRKTGLPLVDETGGEHDR